MVDQLPLRSGPGSHALMQVMHSGQYSNPSEAGTLPLSRCGGMERSGKNKGPLLLRYTLAFLPFTPFLTCCKIDCGFSATFSAVVRRAQSAVRGRCCCYPDVCGPLKDIQNNHTTPAGAAAARGTEESSPSKPSEQDQHRSSTVDCTQPRMSLKRKSSKQLIIFGIKSFQCLVQVRISD